MRDGGVVDEDVEAAEARLDLRQHSAQGGLVGQVEGEGAGLLAEALGQGLQARGVDVQQGQAHAAGDQALADGLADATGGTGNQNDFIHGRLQAQRAGSAWAVRFGAVVRSRPA